MIIYDIETFMDATTIVFKDIETGKFMCFYNALVEPKNLPKYINVYPLKLLDKFFSIKRTLIGYNNIKFDDQIIQWILTNKIYDPKIIYQKAQELITSENKFFSFYPPWKMSFKSYDLLKINHYNNRARMTSLKWLEFTYRNKKIDDLPFDHTDSVNTSVKLESLIKYNVVDVNQTEECYYKTANKFKLRNQLGKYFNKSDSSIGESMFLEFMSKKMNIDIKELKTMRTKRDKIIVKDLIVDYLELNKFKDVQNFFEKVVIKSVDNEISLKGILSYSFNYKGLKIDYGAGGVHASRKGSFYSDTDYQIIDIDVASYYPNLAIVNGFRPEHLGKSFSELYNQIYQDRKTKYPKSTHKLMNGAYKLMLNSVYGKSNSKYSFLYDSLMTCSITINGQLLLTQLCEMLSDLDITFLQLNTDGVTVKVNNKQVEQLYSICKKWEKITKLELEYANYESMHLMDVNNYLAIYNNSKVKRKGLFEIYEDYVNNDTYHKNPSACIIPLALQEFFVNSTPIEDTILNHDDIFDFCYGVKKTRAFTWLPMQAVLDVYPSVETHSKINTLKNQRVIRYYQSLTGYSLFKNWHKKQSLSKVSDAECVSICQIINKKDIDNVNRQFYIDKANKILKEINK